MDRQGQPRGRPIISRLLLWAGVIAALMFLIVVICGYNYGWKWTGLPKRTLWDWLNLLIVPSVLALGGYLFTRSENRRTQEAANQQRDLDRKIAEEQRRLDREIAQDRRQDDTLQAYLDGMCQLLTDKDRPLHRAQPGDSLNTVARARTLTVLPRLDGGRKARVVQFLYESGLIANRRPVLALRGADLSDAVLREAVLPDADLRGAYLPDADLKRADLSDAALADTSLLGANLTGANLNGAKLYRITLEGVTGLTNAQLAGRAELLRNVIMPNGQKYEDWLKDKEGSADAGNNSCPS